MAGMNTKTAVPITFGIVTFAACVSCAMVAHYNDAWALSIFLGFLFALGAALVALAATEGV